MAHEEVARTKHPVVGQRIGDGVHILLLRRYCMCMPSPPRFELGPSPTFQVFRHILLQHYTRPSSDELRQFLLETRVPSALYKHNWTWLQDRELNALDLEGSTLYIRRNACNDVYHTLPIVHSNT